MNPMDLLLRYGGYVNNSSECAVLAVACVHGNISVALLLLEHGADINILDSDKECVLRATLRSPHNAPKVLKFLISKGAPMDSVDLHGYTPLFRAVKEGFFDCIKVLLTAGTNPNFIPHNVNRKTTSLMAVAAYSKSAPEKAFAVIKLLLQHGADVNATAGAGITPLLFFSMEAEYVPNARLLLQHGANVEAACQLNWDYGVQVSFAGTCGV